MPKVLSLHLACLLRLVQTLPFDCPIHYIFSARSERLFGLGQLEVPSCPPRRGYREQVQTARRKSVSLLLLMILSPWTTPTPLARNGSGLDRLVARRIECPYSRCFCFSSQVSTTDTDRTPGTRTKSWCTVDRMNTSPQSMPLRHGWRLQVQIRFEFAHFVTFKS